MQKPSSSATDVTMSSQPSQREAKCRLERPPSSPNGTSIDDFVPDTHMAPSTRSSSVVDESRKAMSQTDDFLDSLRTNETTNDTVQAKASAQESPPFVIAPTRDATGHPVIGAPSSPPQLSLDGDLDFFEACIHQRIYTFAFSGALSFVCSPVNMAEYELTDIGNVSDHNSGPHALRRDMNCNTEFLEQEAWLIVMYTSVTALSSSSSESRLKEGCSELIALLRQEWVRMQLHKEREWFRQREPAELCRRTGASYVDSRKSPPVSTDNELRLTEMYRPFLCTVQSECQSHRDRPPCHRPATPPHLQNSPSSDSHTLDRATGISSGDYRSFLHA